MRSKTILKDFDEVLILYQFLYMSPENRIVINNGMADLEIRLDEDLRFYCKNLNFPHLPDMSCSEQMTLSCCFNAVDYLKMQKPKQFPNTFNSEWDEIKDITMATTAMNFYKQEGL